MNLKILLSNKSLSECVHQLLKTFALFLLRLYQASIRPWFHTGCYFYPSCSEYGHQAIQSQGVLRGVGLIGLRLLKCHPLGKTKHTLILDVVPIKSGVEL